MDDTTEGDSKMEMKIDADIVGVEPNQPNKAEREKDKKAIGIVLQTVKTKKDKSTLHCSESIVIYTRCWFLLI